MWILLSNQNVRNATLPDPTVFFNIELDTFIAVGTLELLNPATISVVELDDDVDNVDKLPAELKKKYELVPVSAPIVILVALV